MRNGTDTTARKRAVRPLIILLMAVFLMPATILPAQEVDMSQLVDGQRFSCEKIALSVTGLIPQFHSENATDTLFSLLSFWQHYCEGPEPLVRFRILYTIETNTFSDDWYPDNILTLLYDYEQMVTAEGDLPYYYDYFDREYVLLDEGFSPFTRALAGTLQQYTDLQPVERFFADFYAHEFKKAFRTLESGELKGTRIDSLYRARQHKILTTKRRYLGAYLGLWKPTGNLATLGNHPQIGFFSGSSHNRAVFGFNALLGFGSAANAYHVVTDNTLFTSEHYLSLHIGVDGGLEIIKTMHNAVIMSVGLAYEGFEAFSVTQQENYGLSKFVGSFNLNFGLEYRFLSWDGSFFGLQAKYHFVNYRNRGGTDFSGNVATFGLVFGLAY